MPGEKNETPLFEKLESGLLKLTTKGHEVLKTYVTSTDESVYVFKKPEGVAASAVMARLSRSPNGGREILASEFMGENSKDEELISRVVGKYGDDSVAQLDQLQLLTEGVSGIAAKAIERGRLAAFLEQSSRYIRFDYKDEEGNYRYVIPKELTSEDAAFYKKKTDAIFDIYVQLFPAVFEHIKATSKEKKQDRAWELACQAQAFDTIRGILPSSTKAVVGVSGSAQAIYNLILRLSTDPLEENRTLGVKLLQAVRMVSPSFFERADIPERGGLISANKELTRRNSRALADKLIEKHGDSKQVTGYYVKLLETFGDEDLLIAKILTDNSDKTFEAMLKLVKKLSKTEKAQITDAYVGERDNRRVKPGRAFELPHYLIEGQMDIGSWRDVQRGRMVDGFEWQPFQTGLGHARPETIDAAGLTDTFEQAFKLSQELYEYLESRGYEDVAQYAVLYGHNVRFSFMTNARSLIHTAELRTTPQGHASYRKFFQDVVKLVNEKHPHIVRVMKFLNKDEDDELARMGALRAEQAKQEHIAKLAERTQKLAK